MQRSEQLNELAPALSKAQGEMEGAAKGKENPHFRQKYADLGAVWDAIREPLANHGLSVTQWMRSAGGEDRHAVEVETLLLHASGQFISDTFAVPVSKIDAQGYGSACTYARRYALMAAVGIAPVDDDANAAVGGKLPEKRANGNGNYQKSPPKKAAEQPPGDPFEAAKSGIASLAFDRILGNVDRCVASDKFSADQKDALLELMAQRALNAATDDTTPDQLNEVVKKITEARKEVTHTFAQ